MSINDEWWQGPFRVLYYKAFLELRKGQSGGKPWKQTQKLERLLLIVFCKVSDILHNLSSHIIENYSDIIAHHYVALLSHTKLGFVQSSLSYS